MGAKNHAIVMPDASEDATLNAIVAAGFGAAGQRCMALSTVVFVGGIKSWYDGLYSIFFNLIHLHTQNNRWPFSNIFVVVYKWIIDK